MLSKSLSLPFLLVLAISTTAMADAVVENVLMARSASKFSSDVVTAYREARNQLPKYESDKELTQLANKLVSASKLDAYTNQPEPFLIASTYEDREEIPVALEKAGIITINKLMRTFVQNEDEKAAVIGHEVLHHLLQHDLLILKTSQSWWFKKLRSYSRESNLPFMSEQNFAAEIVSMTVESIKDDHEAEVDQALPLLLKNAGYNPWAIVHLNIHLLEELKDVAPIYFSPYQQEKLRKRTIAIIEHLKKLNIEDK